MLIYSIITTLLIIVKIFTINLSAKIRTYYFIFLDFFQITT